MDILSGLWAWISSTGVGFEFSDAPPATLARRSRTSRKRSDTARSLIVLTCSLLGDGRLITDAAA